MKAMILFWSASLALATASGPAGAAAAAQEPPRDPILDEALVRRYVESFNRWDKETIKNHIDNAHAWDWLRANIPYFECPDKDIEEIYYFRWWVYRKHIVRTPSGYVITEFLPKVGHSGRFNNIVFAAGLHVEEGRWLRDPQYVESYCRFWFEPASDEDRVKYSNSLTWAVWEFCKTRGDPKLALELLPRFVDDFRLWETRHRHESGLFSYTDNRDGGEYSIGGPGLRPLLNSCLYGAAKTIAEVAAVAHNPAVADEYAAKAKNLAALIRARLWDPADRFFKVIPLAAREAIVPQWGFTAVDPAHNVRELYGYAPWLFLMPPDDREFAAAWREVTDRRGFRAPHGLTTAEQRHPRFMKYRVKRCQWDGPVWPYTTSLTLRAMANLLTGYRQDVVSNATFLDALHTYAASQHRTLPYGERIPWIGEDIHPETGIWLAQAIAFELDDPVVKTDLYHAFERGKDYNHSSFCDLVISDLVGLKSRQDNVIEIAPLVPEGAWAWFCLENVPYHGRNVTILYDRDGTRYRKGRGLSIYLDGKLAARSEALRKLTVTIGPE